MAKTRTKPTKPATSAKQKPARKPTAKPAVKPATPSAAKPAVKPAAPSAIKPAVKPAAPSAARPRPRRAGPKQPAIAAPTAAAAAPAPLVEAPAPLAAAAAPPTAALGPLFEAPEHLFEALPPLPSGPRRAVFIDVENTSSDAALSRVLDDLKVDPTSLTTEVRAIGNWRVVGQNLGRSLAKRGAFLVHSAPAPRVSDWSDLWIAVQVGIWLGRSRPGDLLEIVSHDRAFDAVGDAAAQLGVTFRRVTYHTPGGRVAAAAAEVRDDAAVDERRGRRRSRRGGGRGAAAQGRPPSPRVAPAPASVPATPHRAATPPPVADQRHGASSAQLEDVIARLAYHDPSHTVTLDALTVALKAAGFQRPPGSPRLVTRLRSLRGVEVLPGGRIRLTSHDAPPAPLPVADSFAGSAPPSWASEPDARDLDPRDLGPDDLGASDLGSSDLGPRDLGPDDLGPDGTGASPPAVEGQPPRRSRRRGGRRRGGRRN